MQRWRGVACNGDDDEAEAASNKREMEQGVADYLAKGHSQLERDNADGR